MFRHEKIYVHKFMYMPYVNKGLGILERVGNRDLIFSVSFVIQLLSHIRLFVTPWTAACQAPLSFTISQSLLKLISFESVILSNHLILCRPLLLLPSIFPSIRVCIIKVF